MAVCEVEKIESPVKNWILSGIIFISLLGSLMHFVYDLSGNLPIAGIIAPINESVWEHLKLAFLPTILWWLISYIALNKKHNISKPKWFFSCVTALIVCPLFIVSFYYTYTGAFGFHSLLLDILSLFFGVVFAQLIAQHIYKYAMINRYHLFCVILVFIALTIGFILFTFNPPSFPIFVD